MDNLRSRLYLATLDVNAPRLAQEHGLGLELDHFCTAMNFDTDFDLWEGKMRADMAASDRFILHAPFAELSPCAIDPMFRDVTLRRFRQALALCEKHCIRRMVVHSGFMPKVYFPEWYLEQSSAFFRAFLNECPKDFVLLIENVLDPEPGLLLDMVEAVGDPRAQLCLDVGHAHVVSEIPARQWIRRFAPRLHHFHLHDNDGVCDAHLAPGDGSLGFPGLFDLIFECAPEATITFECPNAIRCADRLTKFGIL